MNKYFLVGPCGIGFDGDDKVCYFVQLPNWGEKFEVPNVIKST